jgi:hypothetical protein
MMESAERELLNRHIYAFGSPTASVYGHMVLRPGGAIAGYTHPNEARWQSPSSGILEFVSAAGIVTRRFSRQSEAVWLGQDCWGIQPFMLVSALRYDGATASTPAVVINSIPKSGTYFLAAALAAAGFPTSGLHLSGRRGVHDYRSLAHSDWHRTPHRQFLDLPVEIVPLIAQGAVTPAHIEHGDAIGWMRRNGIRVLHLKRDLRDALLSLYRFKLKAVDPLSPLDEAWRNLSEPQRLSAFLFYYGERDLAHIRLMALQVAAEPALAFEDIIEGRITSAARETLEDIRPGLSETLVGCLQRSLGAPTSTFSGVRSDLRSNWNSELDAVFRATGLDEANHALGYS